MMSFHKNNPIKASCFAKDLSCAKFTISAVATTTRLVSCKVVMMAKKREYPDTGGHRHLRQSLSYPTMSDHESDQTTSLYCNKCGALATTAGYSNNNKKLCRFPIQEEDMNIAGELVAVRELKPGSAMVIMRMNLLQAPEFFEINIAIKPQQTPVLESVEDSNVNTMVLSSLLVTGR